MLFPEVLNAKHENSMYYFPSLWYDLTGYRTLAYRIQSKHCATEPRTLSVGSCVVALRHPQSTVITCEMFGAASDSFLRPILLLYHSLNCQLRILLCGFKLTADRKMKGHISARIISFFSNLHTIDTSLRLRFIYKQRTTLYALNASLQYRCLCTTHTTP